jgi:hypothetical protein
MAEENQENKNQPSVEFRLHAEVKITHERRKTHKHRQPNRDYETDKPIKSRNYGRKKAIRQRNFWKRG